MSREIKHLFASRVADSQFPNRGAAGLSVSSVRYEFVSTMRMAIFWRDALGVTITEAPVAMAAGLEGFFVNITYEFEQGVSIDARELINELRVPENSALRKELYAALQRLASAPAWGVQRSLKYTVGITREDLDAANGIVYLRDLDMVIGYERYREEALHPYTNAGVLGMLSDTLAEATKGFHQNYLLVDNNQRGGSRWVNTWFGVYELKPVSDPQLADGVYITVKETTTSEPKTVHLTMEEAVKQLGLYDSRASAETFGRPDKRFEAELLERKQEIELEKVQLVREKLEMDRQRAEMAADRDALDAAIKKEDHRMKLERERFEDQVRRDEDRANRERDRWKAEQDSITFERKRRSEREQFDYEERARDRKDDSEYFKAGVEIAKAVLGILSVGLSIYAVMQKSKK